MTALRDRRCAPSQDIAKLDDAQVAELLAQLDGWSLASAAIEKTFRFADYHRTMAFVNALAWISHAADHHPDLAINDFICAAKADALLGEPA